MKYSGKKVSVIGLARSGVAAALLLKREGAVVFGSDGGASSSAYVDIIRKEGIDFELDGHTERAYDASLLVVSPGVPKNANVVIEAQKRGIPVIGELELASAITKADIVAVTGSNGKSTTVSLLGELFKGKECVSRVAGNIGKALSSEIEGLKDGDVLLVETSSFQLDSILDFHPKSAVILKLAPDHLDSYDSADDYYASKFRITKNQTGSDLLVLNADDSLTNEKRKLFTINATVAEFSIKKTVSLGAFVRNGEIVLRDGNTETVIVRVDEIKLPGEHNLSNILAALTVSMPYKLPLDHVIKVLKTFRGIEHRIEWVRELNGVNYWNDSKGTNLDSVVAAIKAMKGAVHLIAGGRDKAGDFLSISNLVKEKVRTVYAIGEAAEIIKQKWSTYTDVVMAERMEKAVEFASSRAVNGDDVLLSPGCASYDQYGNYEERGRHFKKLVEAL